MGYVEDYTDNFVQVTEVKELKNDTKYMYIYIYLGNLLDVILHFMYL